MWHPASDTPFVLNLDSYVFTLSGPIPCSKVGLCLLIAVGPFRIHLGALLHLPYNLTLLWITIPLVASTPILTRSQQAVQVQLVQAGRVLLRLLQCVLVLRQSSAPHLLHKQCTTRGLTLQLLPLMLKSKEWSCKL